MFSRNIFAIFTALLLATTALSAPTHNTKQIRAPPQKGKAAKAPAKAPAAAPGNGAAAPPPAAPPRPATPPAKATTATFDLQNVPASVTCAAATAGKETRKQQTFTKAQLEKFAKSDYLPRALPAGSLGIKNKLGGFGKVFKNFNAVEGKATTSSWASAACNGANLKKNIEFPVIVGATAFSGKAADAGAFRIIYSPPVQNAQTGVTTSQFCGVIAHRPGTGNADFDLCT